MCPPEGDVAHARAGYRVRYFLGTDRIASIPPSIEKRLVVRYQISIPKGLISSTSVRQKACSTRCVRLEATRRWLFSVWHPRERFETIRISLLSTSCGFVYYTQTEVRSRWFQRLPSKWGHKHMNNISRTALRVTPWAFYHLIWVKLASYHIHTEL